MKGAQSRRLQNGGLVDRGRPLTFRFDGRSFGGFAGDTLASALLANGVRLVGRSFKYHRPRGIVTAGVEEPNALVELRTGARREPNTKATTIELFEGLTAASQNRFPSLWFDLLSVNSLLAPFLPAGFYYKTFMWPRAAWEKVYEPAIRRAAGLGHASGEPDPDAYEKSFAFCDVLVVGSGPAGLMTALTAARAGARVLLCEQDFLLGGRLLSERFAIDGAPAIDWVRRAEAELRGNDNVTILTRTSVAILQDGNTFGAIERVSDHLPEPPPFLTRQRYWKIVAKQAVIATGAFERSMPFSSNDRPGVMMASAARTYLNRFGVVPGRRVCIYTTTDNGWATAADLLAANVAVEAVIDPRTDVSEDVTAVAKGVRRIVGGQVVAARGAQALQSIDVIDASGQPHRLEADTLAMSGGFNPALGLSSHLGARPLWSDEIAAFVPAGAPPQTQIVGSARGVFSLASVLADGARAGATALQALGLSSVSVEAPKAVDEPGNVSAFWRPGKTPGKIFVDFQNDVTAGDVGLAAREGYRSVEHLKRYTTLGMGTDQGKTGAVIGQALMAGHLQVAMAQGGTPIARPPDTPVAIGVLAGLHRGRSFRPTRLTSTHAWARAHGAEFVEAGQWLRAQWFTHPGDADWLQTVSREAALVRSAVGVCDVSTLGKIDVQGGDAATFLDRVYTNMMSTLPVGRTRYGLMLREDGFVMDDGTLTRFADDRFFMTTTTANAGKVMQHLEFCHQVLWPELDVQMVSVTEQWAQFSVAGPRARDTLAKIVDRQHDIGDASLPYMASAELTALGGLPARLYRVSFSGELAYEIAVPARYGESLWNAVLGAGEEFGIAPYGTEALSVLRIEKGHAAGGELNGQTTAGDLGLGRLMSTKKDFIGRVMATRPALVDPDRPALVGFRPVDPRARLRAGAHFIAVGAKPGPETDEGHMTAAAFSPVLSCWIGLGLLKRGRARFGARVRAYDPVRNGDVEVEICSPVFYDPEGARLRG